MVFLSFKCGCVLFLGIGCILWVRLADSVTVHAVGTSLLFFVQELGIVTSVFKNLNEGNATQHRYMVDGFPP